MPDSMRWASDSPRATDRLFPLELRPPVSSPASLSEHEYCVQEAAAFAAELFALFARDPAADRADLAFQALRVVRHLALHEVLEGAVLLAHSRYADEAPPDHGDPVSKLGRCTWAFVRAGRAAPPLAR